MKPRRPGHGGTHPQPRYARDVFRERASLALVVHCAAALALFGVAIAAGALRSPLLTALVCAAAAWMTIYGVAVGMRITRHFIWQMVGEAAVWWPPVLWAVFAGLIGGGLDALATR